MKSITYMGSICFEKRKWVIFHILNIQTPHISALPKEINCLNKENANRGSHEFYEIMK